MGGTCRHDGRRRVACGAGLQSHSASGAGRPWAGDAGDLSSFMTRVFDSPGRPSAHGHGWTCTWPPRIQFLAQLLRRFQKFTANVTSDARTLFPWLLLKGSVIRHRKTRDRPRAVRTSSGPERPGRGTSPSRWCRACARAISPNPTWSLAGVGSLGVGGRDGDADRAHPKSYGRRDPATRELSSLEGQPGQPPSPQTPPPPFLSALPFGSRREAGRQPARVPTRTTSLPHRIRRGADPRSERSMASSSAAADEVAPAPAPAEAAEAKGKGKRGGVLGRMWRALFGGREDFEKRLQYLSKEEAAVHARMRRRTQFSRRAVRNLIVLSVLAEVLAVVYAIMMTRDEDLTWQMRAIRVLPMFVLPAVSSLIYSTVVNFTRMLERKDQKTLEKLRAERKAKIDELKERTNYYLTQQLIQKYDLDPAAKAAAASVLASKLGEETGLKLHVGEEPKLDAAVARSNDVEILPSDGLRNRRQPNTRGSRTGSPSAAHTPAQGTESSPTVSAGLETAPALMVVEHHQGTGANDGGWIAKIAALLVGEDPSQSYALICGNCHMHNGLARKEDYPHVTYYCPHCHALNTSKQSMGQYSGSNSGRSTPAVPADGMSASSSVHEGDLSNLTTLQELPKEGNAEKQETEAS